MGRWEYDPAALRASLDAVPAGSWSLPSTYRETRVHHGYRRVILVSAGKPQPDGEPFVWLLTEFAPVREAWLSQIDPGGFIVPHRDGAPWFERWQVPINASGMFDAYRPRDGVAFQVEHWRPHSVWNDGGSVRVHVVIDRDVPLSGHAPQPFETFPIPPDYAHMVEAAR